MLINRLSRLLEDMRKENFIRKDNKLYLFEHASKPNKMAVLRVENEKNHLIICYQVESSSDIHLNIEEMPVVNGEAQDGYASESDLYIEDDELTDMTIDILTQHGVANA